MDSLSAIRSLSTTTPGRVPKASLRERFNTTGGIGVPKPTALPLIDDSSASSDHSDDDHDGNPTRRKTTANVLTTPSPYTSTTLTSGNWINSSQVHIGPMKKYSKSASLLSATTTKKKPSASSSSSSPPPSSATLSKVSREFLLEQGYTVGLLDALQQNKKEFPLSIWIIDNSLSMNTRDGHRIDSNASSNMGDVKFSKCSRWEELQQTLDYHANLATLVEAPTFFRMINEPNNDCTANTQTTTAKTSSPSSQRQKQQKTQERRFHLPQQFSIAAAPSHNGSNNGSRKKKSSNKKQLHESLDIAQRTIQNVRPCGTGTPLAQCLRDVRLGLSSLQSQFQHVLTKGRRYAVVIATDGVPTDCDDISNSPGKKNDKKSNNDEHLNEFVEELKLLMNTFPVWVVLRLCTDDEKVVNYWNNFDSVLAQSTPTTNEISSFQASSMDQSISNLLLSFNEIVNDNGKVGIEVLDDYVSEAKEVYRYNKWLNYGLPLHRLREMGFYNEIFDLLDERTLHTEEIVQFCMILFGKSIMKQAPECHVPTDVVNYTKFIEQHMVSKERILYNPMKRRMEQWINVKELRKALYRDMRKNTLSHSSQSISESNRTQSDRRLSSVSETTSSLALIPPKSPFTKIKTSTRKFLFPQSALLINEVHNAPQSQPLQLEDDDEEEEKKFRRHTAIVSSSSILQEQQNQLECSYSESSSTTPHQQEQQGEQQSQLGEQNTSSGARKRLPWFRRRTSLGY